MMISKKLHRISSRLLLAAGLTAISAQAAAPATPQELVTARTFINITSTDLAALTNNAKFPNNPDSLGFLPYFEWNATGDISTPPPTSSIDNFGGQIAGYFYPPTSGDYIFWIAADDHAVLYLSTDGNPANKKLIAQETAYSDPREYTFSAGTSDLTAKDSSQFTGTQWPTKDPGLGGAKITLEANKPYYIEAVFKEGTGGDNLSVAVSDAALTIDSTMPIPGQYLSSDRANGPVTIAVQPQNQTVDERGSATFSVLPDGAPPYSYQWRKNGTDILDATNLNYTVTGATIADNNAKFSVTITGAEGTATSDDAVLTVTPDTVLPRIVTVGANPNLTEVTLTFSEPVDQTTATALANYQISSTNGPLSITAASLSASGTQVTLTTAPQTLGTKYTLLASNIKDTAATANTIAANTRAVYFPIGKLVETNGMIVIEAENFDRNLDGLWVRDTTRGVPSGGASVVIPNGAGGSEGSTKLEYDVEFAQAGTYYVWFRASADNGNDDSVWFHIDEDGDTVTERPYERVDGNGASMTGFQPQADFVWVSNSQDGPDPFTVEVPEAGPRAIAIARREDGAFVDKILLTTDSAFTPTGLGPLETRLGAPGFPTISIASPTGEQNITAGGSVTFSATAAGQSGLEIARVEYSANGTLIGEATTSPFTFNWMNIPAGIYAVRATAIDEIGQRTTSQPVNVIAAAATGATIGWVSFHPADDTPSAAAASAGFTNAADVAYTKLLEDHGHTVTRIITSGTPNTNLLNQFDLVIISRSVPSGDYQDAAESAAWNGITAPTMILGGYIIRGNRLGFTVGDTIPDTGTNGPVMLAIADPTHPIFDGITVDSSGMMTNPFAFPVSFNGITQRGISVNTDSVDGDGKVLATVATDADPANGGMVIGEWPAGALINGGVDTLGGHRLVFLTGSRENDGLTSEGAGIFDLSPDGTKMFLNAVNYMAGVEPGSEPPTLSITRTATGISITFTGTLQSATTINGKWNDETAAQSPLNINSTTGMKFYRAKQ